MRSMASPSISIPGEIVCVVGESGSGKSMCAHALMGLLPDTVTTETGEILFDGQNLLKLDEDGWRDVRGRRIAMVFQEPMTALNPLMRIGDQMMEMFEAHNLLTPKERRAKALQPRQGSRSARSRAHHPRLSAPAVRRPAPARDDRHGAGAGAVGAGRRRADHGARRHHAGADPQADPQPAAQPQHGGDVHHPRLRRRRRYRRPRRRVAPWQDRGRRHRSTPCFRNPQHDYTKALLAAVPSMHPPVRAPLDENAKAVEVIGLDKTYVTSRRLVQAGPPRAGRQRSHVLASCRARPLGLVGESGSGKSSVARLVMRLIEADRGTVRIGDVDLTALEGKALRAQRHRIQMIFQDPFASLNPRRRVGQIITDGPIAHGTDPKVAMQRARDLLGMVGLDAGALDRYPHEFSGGQRQRIGIARALALDPEIIVADEAVSALDVSVQAQVLKLLEDLKARLGLSMLFITHDLRVAAQICDRIAVMQRGVIVELKPTAQLFAAPEHPYTRELLGAVPGQSSPSQAA